MPVFLDQFFSAFMRELRESCEAVNTSRDSVEFTASRKEENQEKPLGPRYNEFGTREKLLHLHMNCIPFINGILLFRSSMLLLNGVLLFRSFMLLSGTSHSPSVVLTKYKSVVA